MIDKFVILSKKQKYDFFKTNPLAKPYNNCSYSIFSQTLSD